MGLQIFATPDPGTAGLNGDGLSDWYDLSDIDAHSLGYQRAKGYGSINDLIAKIQAALITNPTECLELLEIWAHGNPGVCNGFTAQNIATLGNQLKTWHTATRLCDVVNIYLSGCNTGVFYAGNESLAQALSRQTPTEAGDNVRINVYGSVGYLSGTKMQGNSNTSIDATVHGDYFAPFPKTTDKQGTVVHPGSTASQGAASYRGFREGRSI